MYWMLLHDRLEVNNQVALSVQRYPIPETGILSSPQPSYGALPMHALDAQRILVPVYAKEAVWLGLSLLIPNGIVKIRISVSTIPHGMLDALTGKSWDKQTPHALIVPPATALDGIPSLEGGMWPLSRCAKASGAPACRRIYLHTTTTQEDGNRQTIIVSLVLVSPACYRKLSGMDPPPPAQESDRFGGYLLP